MIAATAHASSLNDLVDDEFLVVAVREIGEATDRWRYWMPKREVKLFLDMVAHREIISPQRREPDGTWVMLGKLARA
jgi:hypothetical protein